MSLQAGARRISLKSTRKLASLLLAVSPCVSALTDAHNRAIRLGNRDLLEDANATSVSALRLYHSRFALLVEEARLVHVHRWKQKPLTTGSFLVPRRGDEANTNILRNINAKVHNVFLRNGTLSVSAYYVYRSFIRRMTYFKKLLVLGYFWRSIARVSYLLGWNDHN